MENATKALMIAGAVLLVILIIGVGMAIFNAGSGTITSGMNKVASQEVQIFNNAFVGYEGTKSGSDVKTLISEVMSSNNTVTNAGEENEKLITVKFDSKDASTQKDLTSVRSKIISGKKYTVELSDYYSAGYIKEITITDVNNKTTTGQD